jgi:hypothetical protein
MVTDVVVVTAEQPPVAAIVYVTVYVPAVLVLGVMAPVLELILKPVVEEYVPVVVPVRVTAPVVNVLQNGEPAYEIVAAGSAVTVTVRVPVAFAQPGPPVTV